ncbi:MAG: PQQ-binding-like beta-propeller repeat protein [Verrucomicrobia bacterium]|nr:PQQ-binding-like beta-propeller repeat protein [Verrucomicrobiota bacterium]
MKRNLALVVLPPLLPMLGLGALLVSAVTLAGQPADSVTSVTPEERTRGYRSGVLLARPRATASDRQVADGEAGLGLRVRRLLGPTRDTRLLELKAGTDLEDTLGRLRASGRYEFVEPDYVVRAHATPNDPRFLAGEQWALRNLGQDNGVAGADIKAEEAWEIQPGAAEVTVAVIDSGMRRSHEDLAPNLWVNPGETGALGSNGRDDDRNGYIDDLNGINATVATNHPASGNNSDAEGHGTAVSSVIGAAGNNNRGMAGVAWSVKLMGLRFLDDDGFGFVSDEIECIDYAIAKGATIINASFGNTSFSQSLFAALQRARNAGIIVVCSAGNDSENNDQAPHYPSSYLLDNIVAVANSTRQDTLSDFSNYGTGLVDLAAPGTSILVADAVGDRSYRIVSGTSFSAPMVTGALALVKQKFPKEHYRETINRVLRGVDTRPAFTGRTATGGRLNVAAALRTTTTRPFNDDFARRATFAGETGTARGSARFATRETGESAHAGNTSGGTLWWTWTAPRSGSVTLDTSAGTIDTVVAVYTGSQVAALTAVASNDDESGSLTTSRVTFRATAGTSYQIAVAAKSEGDGLIALRFSLLASNDDFASAQTVTGRSWSVRADNRAATRETGEPRIRNNTGGQSVWYRWVAPASRRYHLASFSSDFNTMIGVFTGSSLTSLSEVNAATTAGDSNFTMSSAGLTFTATAGTTYHIVLDSEVSSTGTSTTGNFNLSLADSEWEFFGMGPPSTVAVASDGTLHFVDIIGYLYALNPDGSRKWRYTLTGYGTFSAPAVAPDGTVYVGDSAGYLHAVDANGTRRWRTSVSGIVDASPAIAENGTVYVRAEDGRVYALNPNSGATLWTYRVGTTSNSTYSSPVIAPDGTVYCAGSDSKLYAISSTGSLKWTFATDFIYASPALDADGTIYFGVAAPTRRFYALRPDGTLKWELVVGDTVSSSAAIGLDGTLYFGCADRKLYAVSPGGEVRWTYETGDAIRNCSPLVASDGTILVGSNDGKLSVIDPAGTLRRTYATANELRASPTLHRGRLYVPSYDYRLYAFETGQVPASPPWPMLRQNVARLARRITSALAIEVQPKPVTAEVGETVTFSVGAVGTSPISYQWMQDGKDLAGATGAVLRVDPVIHAKGGAYSVRVTDAKGSVTSTPASLTVSTPLIPPAIFTAPVAQSGLAGETLTLSVAVTGSTPLTYQWLRDGAPIAGATTSTYVLTRARPSDSGRYSVRVGNFGGEITSSAAVVTVAPISRISNLSIRSQVTDSPLTVGLTVGGSEVIGTKPLLIRAVGPTLAAFGVNGALEDPLLAVLAGSSVVAQNNDWAGNAQISALSAAVGAFGLANPTSKDSALAFSPNSGGYTVRITGANDTTGVTLAEVYDATGADDFIVTTPRLTNVSALTRVGTGGDVLIAGFSITGTTPKTVLIRGIGPTLAAFGVTDVLADPKLELFASGAATATASNDNWSSATNAAAITAGAAKVGAFALAPDSRDAVLLLAINPGSYTVQVSGIEGATGTALIEIYEVP